MRCDDGAKVWYLQHSELEGVHAEGDPLEALCDKLPGVLGDMVEDNDRGMTDDVLIEIIARTSTRVAA